MLQSDVHFSVGFPVFAVKYFSKLEFCSNMKVDMVADKVHMVADMKVGMVAYMKVDMVADQGSRIKDQDQGSGSGSRIKDQDQGSRIRIRIEDQDQD